MARFATWLLCTLCLVTIATAVDTPQQQAQSLLDEIRPERGLCVVVGDGAGALGVALAGESKLTVYVQSPSADDVTQARAAADAAGLLGSRVFVQQGNLSHIGLADRLADAVVVTDASAVAHNELIRVLHPGGVLLDRDGRIVTRCPVQPGTGVWSHPYHGPDNNPQSEDAVARAPFTTQFLAQPYYGPMPQVTVAAGGRLFKAFGHIAFKEREQALLNTLLCLNTYNGTELWRRELTPGFMLHRNTLVATEDTLYLGDNRSCKLIDAATGQVRDEIVVPDGLADGPVWKWMALEGGVLYALVGEEEPLDAVRYGVRDQAGWPWGEMGDIYNPKAEYPWGFGRTLLALDPQTKKVLWSRQEEQKIDSRAVCMRGGRIFLYSHPNYLAAIDVTDGAELWRTSDEKLLAAIGPHDPAQNPRRGYSSQVYLKCSDEALYFAGPQRKQLVAASTEDGRLLWVLEEEGNFQLVLRDDGLYAMGRENTSRKLDPLTGDVLASLDCFRGNCTRATGTFDTVFARGNAHGGTLQYSVGESLARRIPAMRPACQDGVLAAHGLLYWGPWMCDCNHSLIGVISLAPAGDFDFEQSADPAERLVTLSATPSEELTLTDGDWPTYRANNARTGSTRVNVPRQARLLWTHQPTAEQEPTAPVTAGGLVFVSGADGAVRALNAADGTLRWSAYTGAAVRYPPTIADSRVLVGSGDGWVHCFAAHGEPLWRFRAAPTERTIPVFGRLMSTWPVASGVLVENGTAYAAAGIAALDGTHVYALDVESGALRWQNNTSARLSDDDTLVSGVAVQGHLLLADGKLYLAGGNDVSPGIYDAATGECLNMVDDPWASRAPRGSELFLVDGEVAVIDKLLYAPREYIPSRYFAKYLLQAGSGNVVIQGTQAAMMRVAPGAGKDGLAKLVWQDEQFLNTAAVVLAGNAVLVAATVKGDSAAQPTQPILAALDIDNGQWLWSHPLPAPAFDWGLAVDRDGRAIVTLVDGRVLCYGE